MTQYPSTFGMTRNFHTWCRCFFAQRKNVYASHCDGKLRSPVRSRAWRFRAFFLAPASPVRSTDDAGARTIFCAALPHKLMHAEGGEHGHQTLSSRFAIPIFFSLITYIQYVCNQKGKRKGIPEMTNMIETAGLKKSFVVPRTKRKVEAVRGIGLQVAEGEIFGFLGPNGAGKTTTLRMLTTLLPPDEGQATIAGHDLLREPTRVRERIGYVSQSGGTDGAATGRENLALQAQLYGMNRQSALKRTAEIIAKLEMTEFADRLARTYSGGQRRRLDLGLGIVHRPKVLFLDEPSSGLDPQSRARLWEEVNRLRLDGTTVFLTTHYLDEADTLCDRLAIIDGGKIITEGTPEQLKQQITGDVITFTWKLQAERPGKPVPTLSAALPHPGQDFPMDTKPPGDDLHRDEPAAYTQAQEILHTQPFVRAIKAGDEMLQVYVDNGEEALVPLLHLLEGAGMEIRTTALARPTLDDVFLRLTGRSLREQTSGRM